MKKAMLLTLQCVTSYYIAIDNTHFPALTTWDGRRVDWSTGVAAALLDTSKAVRISARGMHFYDHDIYPMSDPIPCRRSPDCLCVMPSSSMAFPEYTAPRYAFGSSQCGSSSASRVIIDDPSIYDISMCDLVTAQVDVIWRDGYIYVDNNLQLPDWAYIVAALAVLFLVISLGQNIARIMGDDLAVTQPLITEVVCIGLVILILVINDPIRVFVAEHDRVMLVAAVSYLALNTARQGFQLVFEPYVYTFNVITVTLMLVTARLYCSFETPYATIFLALLLTRLFHKINAKTINAIERFAIATDGLLIALHYRLAFRPSFWDPQCAPVYAAAIVVMCYTMGVLTAKLHQKPADPAPNPNHVNVRGPVFAQNHTHAVAFRAHGSDAGHNPMRLDVFH